MTEHSAEAEALRAEIARLDAERDAVARQLAAMVPARIQWLYAEVTAVDAELAAAQDRVNTLAERRGVIVHELHALGQSYRTIGRHLGLSAPRIGQIVTEARARSIDRGGPGADQ